jgi:hypothetical protein
MMFGISVSPSNPVPCSSSSAPSCAYIYHAMRRPLPDIKCQSFFSPSPSVGCQFAGSSVSLLPSLTENVTQRSSQTGFLPHLCQRHIHLCLTILFKVSTTFYCINFLPSSTILRRILDTIDLPTEENRSQAYIYAFLAFLCTLLKVCI